MCGYDIRYHKILGKRLNVSQGKNPHKKKGISTTIMKCKDCGLIYSNPQPIPFDIQDHYGIPPENYWIEDYFLIDPNYFQNEISIAKKLISFHEGMKSLDVGAGLGKAMIALSNAGFDAYGFEPSIPFYERAISKMKINPRKLKLGMIENVDYPENEFDFISFGAVLEHLYDPSGAIKKTLQWLKPAGVIHIEVPSSAWLINKIINAYYSIRGTDYVGNISPMHTPFHLYEFGLKSFQKNGKKTGYEVMFYEYYVCKTFMPKAFDFFLKPYMRITHTGMQLCVWLKK
jgi:2-polyprenyl-3-methyl-5-hydroxy-6-metoxy-1,4-benzoquinol methylase